MNTQCIFSRSSFIKRFSCRSLIFSVNEKAYTMEGILDTRVLKFSQGQVKGAIRETIYGEKYYSFEGIPYGKPPLGELRFKAPQPAEKWTEILDCTECRSKATQKNVLSGQSEGTEDCLYLNVYAKELQSKKPLPVMVYIYGGGFYMGEATRQLYSPDYFMRKDVILVTFNYRLCSLGFISFKDPELGVPGNAGLKDQVLALRWIKEHIAQFNGDPENITLFGESAGGASTHYMTLTEQTRGLFQRAIVMSGCVLNLWANLPPTDLAFRLAKYNGYTGDNIDRDVLAYLRKLERNKLVEHSILNESEIRNGYTFAFTPVVEPYVGPDCVIPKPPFEMMKIAWSNSIPMMIGGTSEEGLLMYPRLKLSPERMNSTKSDLQRLLPLEVRQQHTEAENQVLSEKIKQLHFGGQEPSSNTMMEFLDMYSYKIFWHGGFRTVLARLKYAPSAPTYFYRFNFDSPNFNLYRSIFCEKNITKGVSHADDLPYLFYCKFAWKLDTDSAEFKTIERMVSIWTSFAQNSNPNCKAIEPADWKQLKVDNPYQALNISHDIEFIELPEKAKLEVWNSLYKKEKLY